MNPIYVAYFTYIIISNIKYIYALNKTCYYHTLAFKNGKICFLAIAGALSVFNGGFNAACINLEYTWPSYDPIADSNVSSQKSNASTKETAIGRILLLTSCILFSMAGKSWVCKNRNVH